MDIIVIMYVFALAFQISGAIILILKYWGNTQQRIIDEYYPGAGIANNDGDDNAVLEVDRVRDCAIEIYSNRAAFIFIAIGYTLSIFGEKGTIGNIIILVLVIVMSLLLIFAERKVVRMIADYFYKEDIIISYDYLPKHIDRTMSNRDLDDLLSIFDERKEGKRFEKTDNQEIISNQDNQ